MTLAILVFSIDWGSSAHAATLYGVTGDGANMPESLAILSQTDGTPTFLSALENGNSGEAIAFNPDDGLLYHWSGSRSGDRVFESIDPGTLAVSIISVRSDPVDATYSEALGATFNPSTGELLVVDLNQALLSFTTSGVVTKIGFLDHLSKGLAFVGDKLYSIEQTFGGAAPRLLEIDPTSASTLSQIEISLPSSEFKVNRGNGLATNPDTGQLWALLTVRGTAGTMGKNRLLVSVDHLTGEATGIGFTGDAFASIAFLVTSFEAFHVDEAKLDFKSDGDRFDVKGKFYVDRDGPSIDPVGQEVVVSVGTASITIAPGNFETKKYKKHKKKRSRSWGKIRKKGKKRAEKTRFEFKGVVDGVWVDMEIESQGWGDFDFKAKAKGLDLSGSSVPLHVGLALGDLSAKDHIQPYGKMKFRNKRSHHDDKHRYDDDDYDEDDDYDDKDDHDDDHDDHDDYDDDHDDYDDYDDKDHRGLRAELAEAEQPWDEEAPTEGDAQADDAQVQVAEESDDQADDAQIQLAEELSEDAEPQETQITAVPTQVREQIQFDETQILDAQVQDVSEVAPLSEATDASEPFEELETPAQLEWTEPPATESPIEAAPLSQATEANEPFEEPQLEWTEQTEVDSPIEAAPLSEATEANEPFEVPETSAEPEWAEPPEMESPIEAAPLSEATEVNEPFEEPETSAEPEWTEPTSPGIPNEVEPLSEALEVSEPLEVLETPAQPECTEPTSPEVSNEEAPLSEAADVTDPLEVLETPAQPECTEPTSPEVLNEEAPLSEAADVTDPLEELDTPAQPECTDPPSMEVSNGEASLSEATGVSDPLEVLETSSQPEVSEPKETELGGAVTPRPENEDEVLEVPSQPEAKQVPVTQAPSNATPLPPAREPCEDPQQRNLQPGRRNPQEQSTTVQPRATRPLNVQDADHEGGSARARNATGHLNDKSQDKGAHRKPSQGTQKQERKVGSKETQGRKSELRCKEVQTQDAQRASRDTQQRKNGDTDTREGESANEGAAATCGSK